MKQLGNLSIIVAQRDDLCLSIYNGKATVHMGCGPDKKQITLNWNDDEAINKLTYELNHGEYRQKGVPAANAVVPSAYVCYEENCSDLAREAGAINEMTLFFTKQSRNAWIAERLEQAKTDKFFVDKEVGGEEELADRIQSDDSFDITLFRGYQENWNDSYDIIARKLEIKI